MLSVGRVFRFEAAHKLPDHKGKCKNLHGHGYKLEIEVTSKLESNGMIVDFGDLKKKVEASIINLFDHGYLNDHLEIPTAENLFLEIVNVISLRLSGIYDHMKLVRAKLWETENCYAKWEAD